ncbi:MAG: peptide ABC transporter substrate-binding protein [Clostridia bacterium]|nr:peptide ABC transporter substrate-binding protein [Clostridia bacterium]
MKTNFIKYIFIIFIIVIIGAVIYKENKEEEIKTEEPATTQVEDEIVKEITLGVAEFDTINPILSKNKHIQEISRMIFEPLLELDEQYKLQKCLAKDWAKTSETTYLVKIRDDIKWSDGTQLLVEDVIFTIQTLKNVLSIYTSNVQNITSVDKVDQDTLQITLDREIPFFEYNLIFPIMSRTYYEGQDFSTTDKNKMPIGTGKYKIVQNISNAIILNKNEYYSKDKLTLEKITITKYANLGELYNAFKLGKIDIITTTNIRVEDYIGTIGYNKQEISGREFDFLALNTQNTVLSEVEVRKALTHAINKENIIASLYNNKYKVTNYPLDYGNWLKGDSGDYSYNPELAKQILEQNGWQFKYNRWQKTINYSTKILSFKIVVQATNQTRVSVAEMIKADLEAIGINVLIIKANDNQYKYYLQNKNYDSIIMGTTLSLSPNLETYFGSSNYANFSNDELNNLMNEVNNITKEELLQEKYNRIREIYNEQNPYIGLYSSYYNVASSWSLIGSIPANWYNIFIDINNWYKN